MLRTPLALGTLFGEVGARCPRDVAGPTTQATLFVPIWFVGPNHSAFEVLSGWRLTGGSWELEIETGAGKHPFPEESALAVGTAHFVTAGSFFDWNGKLSMAG